MSQTKKRPLVLVEQIEPRILFQLTAEEAEAMRSQIVTASSPNPFMRSQTATASKRNIRYLPNAFTEHGALMAAAVLNTSRAIEVSPRLKT
jgi:hypothetical protein